MNGKGCCIIMLEDKSSGFIGFIYISVIYFICKKNMNDPVLTLIHKEK